MFAYPTGPQIAAQAVPVLAMVIVPALLMVSTIRFRSFKTLDLQLRRSYTVLHARGRGTGARVGDQPEVTLVAMAYTYLASAFIGMAWTRLRRRTSEEMSRSRHAEPPAADEHPS